MQKARSLAGRKTDLEWLRRGRLLNTSLLIIGSMLVAVFAISIDLYFELDRLDAPMLQAGILLVGGTWLLIAYIFSRMRRYRIAGGMIVALVLIALTAALYVVPDYRYALLPFATIPIALTAMLLGRRAVYLAAITTIVALFGVDIAARQWPPPAFGLALPAPSVEIDRNLAALALFVLALILAPLRGELARVLELLRQREDARTHAERSQQSAESDRDRIIEQLEWQQQNFAAVLEQISDGVIAINAAGKVVRANSTAASLWNEIASGDLIGQRIEQLRAKLSGPTAAAQYVDVIELPPDASARDEGYTHVLLDRRERARLARLRGELMSLLADEMRNPLTSMVTALEMTLGQNLPDGADRVLVGARRSGQRLLDLVTTMLEIHQIEHNQGVLRRSPAPLRPILDAGIAQTTALQHQGAVTVVVEYSGDGVVMIDGDRIRRAFVHLLEHALRQSPPYSTVQVRTEAQNDSMVVRISDQGPGLTPQQRDVLFDQRATPDERRAPALGLAFSKLVIETHGGRIQVESSGSHGTTYAFTLPVDRRAES
jgi:signal transduction histidine kinase